MTSSLPPLVQACSGALGSAAANAVSYPLDLVATRLQTTTSRKLKGIRGVLRMLRYIMRTEGLAGLYDGLGSDTASTLISNFLYFYFYSLLHALAARRRASSNTPVFLAVKQAVTSPTRPVLLGAPTELAVGFIAGVTSRAISTPLSVITVRLQTSGEDESDADSSIEKPATRDLTKRPPTFAEVVRCIYAEDGLSGFWTGFRPTLPLCLSPALTFLLMQFLSRLRISRKAPPSSQSAMGAFLGGAFANTLTITIIYPILLAKVRVQAARARPQGTRTQTTSMTNVWSAAMKAEGFGGLYRALCAQILKGFVSQGVTMLVKQRIERAVIRMYTSSKQ